MTFFVVMLRDVRRELPLQDKHGAELNFILIDLGPGLLLLYTFKLHYHGGLN